MTPKKKSCSSYKGFKLPKGTTLSELASALSRGNFIFTNFYFALYSASLPEFVLKTQDLSPTLLAPAV